MRSVQRLLDVSLLVSEHAEKMQRLDVVRRKFENARIETIGLIQEPTVMQFDGIMHRLGDSLALTRR